MSEVHGPVDFLLLEFEGDRLKGKTAEAVVDLVERGVVRLYDLVIVQKTPEGDVIGAELTSELVGEFRALAGAQSGLLTRDDIDMAGEVLNPGTTAVLLVYENAWAVPFVAAALEEGGSVIASTRIPATDVMAALDELEQAKADA